MKKSFVRVCSVVLAVLLLISATTVVASAASVLPMVDNGIIGITGAKPFTEYDSSIEVELPAGTKEYNFKAIGLKNYTVKIYGDKEHTLLADSEMIIKPETQITRLYATATLGEDYYEYEILIYCDQTVKIKDKAASWAQQYLDYFVKSKTGIIRGDEKGKFNGAKNITRYEMATLMVRLTGVNKDLYKNVKLSFEDEIVDWAANYVKAAVRTGLVEGYPIENKQKEITGYQFKGADTATRSEFVKVYLSAVGYMTDQNIEDIYKINQEYVDGVVEEKKFADIAEVGDWAKPYMYIAVAEGILQGDGAGLKPNDVITRNEVVTVMGRMYVVS